MRDIRSMILEMASNGHLVDSRLYIFLLSGSIFECWDSYTMDKDANGGKKMLNIMARTKPLCTGLEVQSLISILGNLVSCRTAVLHGDEVKFFERIWTMLKPGPMKLESLYDVGKDLGLDNYEKLIDDWIEKYWLNIDGNKVSLSIRQPLDDEFYMSMRIMNEQEKREISEAISRSK